MRKLEDSILIVLAAIILIMLSVSITGIAIAGECTLIKGAKVVQALPGGKARMGIHPEDTRVEVVQRVAPENIKQLNKITKLDWSKSFTVTFAIHPNPKDPGFAENIYLSVRSIDLNQCTK